MITYSYIVLLIHFGSTLQQVIYFISVTHKASLEQWCGALLYRGDRISITEHSQELAFFGNQTTVTLSYFKLFKQCIMYSALLPGHSQLSV